MVGSAVWRWCNVLALIPLAPSSVGPEEERATNGGDLPSHYYPATDCRTEHVTSPSCQSSVGLSTIIPVHAVKGVVNTTSLNMGSTVALVPGSTTHSNITAGDTSSSQGRVVPPASSGHRWKVAEEDTLCLTSDEVSHHLDFVSEKTEVKKDCNDSNSNATFLMNSNSDVGTNANRCSEHRKSSLETLDLGCDGYNLVPYSANTSAIKNISKKCVRVNQDQQPLPWFSNYGEDMYEHVTKGLIYIETSIPGPGLDLDTFEQMPQGCNCHQDCSSFDDRKERLSLKANPSVHRLDADVSAQGYKNASAISECVGTKRKNEADQNCSSVDWSEGLAVINSCSNGGAQNSRFSQDGMTVSCSCSCLDRTPASYKDGLLLQSDPKWPIYECNDDCRCPSSSSPLPFSSGCNNRVVQRGPLKDLAILRAKGSDLSDNLKCESNDLSGMSVDNPNKAWSSPTSPSVKPKDEDSLCHQASNCRSAENVSISIIDKVHQSNSREENVPERICERGTCLPDKGSGVFTKSFITRGAFICEYAGELLGEEEAKRRFARQKRERKSNYILVLREFYGEDDVALSDASTCTNTESPTYSSASSDYLNRNTDRDATGQECEATTIPRQECEATTIQNSRNFHLKEGSSSLPPIKPSQVTIIDPTFIGNIGRYLNHSCDPNTHVVPVRINSVVPVAAMFALRDVQPGEELVYDYGSVREAAPPQSWRGDSQSTNAVTEGVCCAHSKLERESMNTASIEMKDVNANLSGCNCCLDSEELEKRNILKRDNCWSQGGSARKKEKLVTSSFSETVPFDVQATSSRPDKLERLAPMSKVNDVTGKTPCLCGAQNCRGFLPAEINLF